MRVGFLTGIEMQITKKHFSCYQGKKAKENFDLLVLLVINFYVIAFPHLEELSLEGFGK